MSLPDARRDLIIAAIVGLIVTVTVGIGGALMLASAEREALPELGEKIREGSDTVGQAVAEQIRKALDYGIPLSGLYGVDRYFENVVSGVPTIDALALVDSEGTVLTATGEDVAGLEFPVTSGTTVVANVILTPAPPLFGHTVGKLRLALAAAALLFGLLGTCLTFLVLRRNVSAGRARLRTLMQGVSNGVFPTRTLPSGRGATVVALGAFDYRMAPLEASIRHLEDEVATVRAIDFDGSLAAKLDPILAPVTAARGIIETGAPSIDRAQRRPFALWLVVTALGLYAMAAPFVANFAIDRQWAYVPPEWWASVPWIGECAAAMLAYAFARNIPQGSRPGAAMSGLLIAGLSFAAVYGLREYNLFLESRAVAGAGLGVAVAALASGRSGHAREPLLPVMLSIAVLIVAPLLGGLLGEAIGRRMTFLTIGVLLVALALASLTVRWNAMGAGRHAPSLGWSSTAAAAGIPIGAVWLVLVPSGPGYENYLAGGLLIAVSGIAATFAGVPRRSIGLAVVLAGIALLTWSMLSISDLQSGLATGLGMIFLGASAGGLIRSSRERTTTLFLSIGAGLIAGAASASLAGTFGLPPLSISVALIVVLVLADAVAARRTSPAAV